MPGFSGGDFIHANWIVNEFLSKKLICAQGPMEKTIADFWRMIWQEQVELIIMLCKIEEDGKQKCAQYWPTKDAETISFCGITITKLNMCARNDVTMTILTISYGKETRRLRHFHWTSWPDRYAPRHLITPYTLHGISKTAQGPVVVHCSAGIGRTGTFVMVEIVYRCLRAGNKPSVVSLLWDLRSQRAGSVQTFDQFLYIFYATIQRLINRGAIDPISVTNFCKIYEERFHAKTGQTPIEWPKPKRRVLIEKRSRKRRKGSNKARNRKISVRKLPVPLVDSVSPKTVKQSPSDQTTLDKLPSKEAISADMSKEAALTYLSAETLDYYACTGGGGGQIPTNTCTKQSVNATTPSTSTNEINSLITNQNRSESMIPFAKKHSKYAFDGRPLSDWHTNDVHSIASDMAKFDIKLSSPQKQPLNENNADLKSDAITASKETVASASAEVVGSNEEEFFAGAIDRSVSRNNISVYMQVPQTK